MSIDCTELFCQKSSRLTIQISLFPHYKNHITYKSPVKIPLSEEITFISGPYDGSTSDFETV